MSAGAVTVVVGRFGAVMGRGLRQVLGEDRAMHVIAQDLDVARLEAVVCEREPEVAVLDETWAITSALPARLINSHTKLRIVVLASRPTREYAMRLLSLGVTACLPKDASAAEILTTIHLAAHGTHVLSFAPGHATALATPRSLLALTPREREVVACLGLGHKNAQIASQLCISVETVRTHVASIYRKLGVSTRRDLLGIDLLTRQ
jgi:DNA-binding NarL/FixJ family response regulator